MKNQTLKRATIAFGLVCLAVAVVVYSSLELIERDRSALVERFSEGRLIQLDEITRQLEQGFSEIGRTLQAAGTLTQEATSREELERSLRIFITPLSNYYRIERYDAQGQLLLSVQHPTAAPILIQDTTRATAETVSAALSGREHQLEMSAPLPLERGGWYRALAISIRDAQQRPAGAIAALIDTRALFQVVKVVGSGSQLLVLGPRGRPTPVTPPLLAKPLEDPASLQEQTPTYAELTAQMKSGNRGTLQLSEEEATLLGLGGSEVIVAYGPIAVGVGHWSVATLTSTASLRELERAVQLRLGLAAGLVSLCLFVFGVYVVLVSRREITIRERLRQAEQLAHLHEKTEKILDQIPTGVIVFSETNKMTAFNRILRERLPLATVGQGLAEGFPEAPRPVIEHLQALLQEAQSEGEAKSSFGDRLCLFGEEGQYNLHAIPLEPRDPEARLLLVIEDVSKVSRLESQLVRAEKLATVGVLAAGIAHEVGTPLGVVRWRAESILKKLGEESAQTNGLRVIIDQIDHVTRIIRQLLDFSRIRPAQAHPLSLRSVVTAVEDLIRYEGERRKITLSVEIPSSLPQILADRTQLQQVLVNLLLNAYDACSEGGAVSLIAYEEEGVQRTRRVCIEVRDTGCGIPEAHLQQVFDPFFTTKKRGKGTGLGMMIAAQIVRDHGGQIELESKVGQGTRVILCWPIALEKL